MSKQEREFLPLNIAIMVVSDSRTEETDTSGKTLINKLTAAGHNVLRKPLSPTIFI